MIFWAEIRPHSPPKKENIFLLFLSKIPHPKKEEHNKQEN